jgi:hypothetical protein
MASRKRPASKPAAPDPARSYERARPEEEAGMGRLDNNVGTPVLRADHIHKAVANRHVSRQINSEDVVNEREEQKSIPDRLKHRGESESE